MGNSYTSYANFSHQETGCTGILLTNLGTPEAPTAPALRNYLGEFLADPRVVELPRWLWRIILHGIILRTRPARSAKNYAKIWTDQGSPLLYTSLTQQSALQTQLEHLFQGPVKVALGMRYGQPSIASALEELREAGARRLLVLPLYPQYSSATTGSTWDAISCTLQGWRWLPDLRFVSHYHDHPAYIHALCEQIRQAWREHKQPQKLIFSFHGIPKRTFLAGDPYYCECQKTARLVAESLQLPPELWEVCFQSRFGREEWLQPYTDKTLEALGQQGVKSIDVICPGFSADCLETLEEIDQENRTIFLQAGGESFHYIPALNAETLHIEALKQIISQHSSDWQTLGKNALEQAAQQCEQHYQSKAIDFQAGHYPYTER